jgi:tetratricopeptide (TPR) repeat protein
MLPQVMTWEGHRLVQAGKEAEAKEAYRRALAEFPGHAEAREALSTLERKPVSTTPQDPRAAEAEHREQIRSDPQNPKHYNNLGVALYQQGKLGQAEAAYREAIRLNPGAPVVWGNLGLVLEQQGRHDEAVEAYRQAAKLDPSNMAVRERLQRLEKGRIEAGSPTPSSQPAGIGGGPRRVDVEGAVQRGVRELLDKHRTPGSFNPDGSERK